MFENEALLFKQALQVFRCLTHPVIRRNDYQRLVESNLIVYKPEQISQQTINPQDVVFGLKTRRPEYMTDIISYGKTDRQKVGSFALS